MTLISHDPQTIIRTARKDYRCACHLRAHQHNGDPYGTPGDADPSRWCENVIHRGEIYPEYVGEVPAFQSGARYCPACRADQLGDWIEEVK